MKTKNWNWDKANKMVVTRSLPRLRKCARVIEDRTRKNAPVGTISRPMYRSGPYAGQPWTARDAGQLKKSVRIVERDTEKYGFNLAAWGNVRVYVGHYLAWYARIVESYTPYLRPAVESSRGQVKSIMENG